MCRALSPTRPGPPRGGPGWARSYYVQYTAHPNWRLTHAAVFRWEMEHWGGVLKRYNRVVEGEGRDLKPLSEELDWRNTHKITISDGVVRTMLIDLGLTFRKSGGGFSYAVSIPAATALMQAAFPEEITDPKSAKEVFVRELTSDSVKMHGDKWPVLTMKAGGKGATLGRRELVLAADEPEAGVLGTEAPDMPLPALIMSVRWMAQSKRIKLDDRKEHVRGLLDQLKRGVPLVLYPREDARFPLVDLVYVRPQPGLHIWDVVMVQVTKTLDLPKSLDAIECKVLTEAVGGAAESKKQTPHFISSLLRLVAGWKTGEEPQCDWKVDVRRIKGSDVEEDAGKEGQGVVKTQACIGAELTIEAETTGDEQGAQQDWFRHVGLHPRLVYFGYNKYEHADKYGKYKGACCGRARAVLRSC